MKYKMLVTNGRKCNCRNCGESLAKGLAEFGLEICGTPAYFCGDCAEGNFKNGGKAFKPFSLQKSSKESLTEDHIIKVVCTNPIDAIQARVTMDWSSEQLENGDFVLTSEIQHSCYQGGHYFDDNGDLLGGYLMFTVNGKPCKTRREYHEAVSASTQWDL